VAYVPEAAEDTHGGAVPPRLAHLRHHGRRGGGHHGRRRVEDEGDDAEQHPRRDEGLPPVDVGDLAHDGADEDEDDELDAPEDAGVERSQPGRDGDVDGEEGLQRPHREVLHPLHGARQEHLHVGHHSDHVVPELAHHLPEGRRLRRGAARKPAPQGQDQQEGDAAYAAHHEVDHAEDVG